MHVFPNHISKMASSSLLVIPCTILFFFFSVFLSGLRNADGSSCYKSIISFGDSIADTGNLLLLNGGGSAGPGRLPYGETYFHHSTGRFSDGRLIIDFIAEAVGLPLVPPYAGGAQNSSSFKSGVNFAVGGGTALSSDFFRKKGIMVSNGYSLDVQMGWFKKLLPSLCSSDSECKDTLGKSLFLVGEIGGNDYNNAILQKRTMKELRTLVPSVVSAIGSTIAELIGMGATTLVVPGNFPIGCNSVLLTTFKNSPQSDYDEHTGCIKWLNEFAEYQNSKLQEELDSLRQQHPSAQIIYADYYNATLSMFRSPGSFGFGDDVLKACCGGGGPYNADPGVLCWDAGAKLCDDPSKYVCWDGVHLTEAAYRTIANQLLAGPLAMPIVNSTCPKIAAKVDDKQNPPVSPKVDDGQSSGAEMGLLQKKGVVAMYSCLLFTTIILVMQKI
ncbi:GDSL esterase/lipase-like [Iris pallida]|uniref:GDSL esterase/lipase-like n=1 Tax=Iris pallida TaxID=29817 RepID=A0AAX6GJ48_IRIPA|nr:GDSL esterase/lipase-like [Iris pallida]